MNSIIEAQRELDEQRFKIRLLELKNLKRVQIKYPESLIGRAMSHIVVEEAGFIPGGLIISPTDAAKLKQVLGRFVSMSIKPTCTK